jgi:hypothetical protein
VPGLGSLKAIKAQIDQAPTPADLAAMLLAQVGPVLAPFQLLLRLIEVLLGIVEALGAITNPFKLAKIVKKILQLLSLVVAFAPGVAWIRCVRDVINIFVAILRGVVAVMQQWIREINGLRGAFVARDSLPPDLELIHLINCSKARLNASITGVNATLGDIATAMALIGKLIEVLAKFFPPNIAKSFALSILSVVSLPAQLVGLTVAVDAMDTAEQADKVLDAINVVSVKIDDVSSLLASISQALTEVIGG